MTESVNVSSPVGKTRPKITLLTMFQLGLFQMALGMMSLLALGVLNRIMIDELRVIPIIASLAIAMHQFVSPARLWFGQLSDTKPIGGYHRSVYIWLGAILFTSISYLALQAIWQLGYSIEISGWTPITYFWSIIVALAFAIYGFALSASSTPFAALLVDISDEDNRSKLIGVVWSMLMVGIVVGAIISSTLLTISPTDIGENTIKNTLMSAINDNTVANAILNINQLKEKINPVFIKIPSFVFFLCLIATWGVEKKYSRFAERSHYTEREDQITFKTALKILTSSRQTGIFFGFLLVLTISIFMQDAILEPFGGEVFNLPIAETTKLNVPFGMGTLLGISLTGFLIIPRIGKQNTTRYGCLFAISGFGLIILSGLLQDVKLLKSGLLLFGLSAGMITAGSTSLMLDLTLAETAGTFIGAWGLAQAMARGISTVLGGAILNLGKLLFTQLSFAYGLVFFCQAMGMLFAVYLLSRVNIHEFQSNTETAIVQVMEGEI